MNWLPFPSMPAWANWLLVAALAVAAALVIRLFFYAGDTWFEHPHRRGRNQWK